MYLGPNRTFGINPDNSKCHYGRQLKTEFLYTHLQAAVLAKMGTQEMEVFMELMGVFILSLKKFAFWRISEK